MKERNRKIGGLYSKALIIIIVSKTMFMVLSSWQSHCESSPGSFDECIGGNSYPPHSEKCFGM